MHPMVHPGKALPWLASAIGVNGFASNSLAFLILWVVVHGTSLMPQIRTNCGGGGVYQDPSVTYSSGSRSTSGALARKLMVCLWRLKPSLGRGRNLRRRREVGQGGGVFPAKGKTKYFTCKVSRSSKREVRIRVPFSSVVYFSRGNPPPKGWSKGTTGGPGSLWGRHQTLGLGCRVQLDKQKGAALLSSRKQGDSPTKQLP